MAPLAWHAPLTPCPPTAHLLLCLHNCFAGSTARMNRTGRRRWSCCPKTMGRAGRCCGILPSAGAARQSWPPAASANCECGNFAPLLQASPVGHSSRQLTRSEESKSQTMQCCDADECQQWRAHVPAVPPGCSRTYGGAAQKKGGSMIQRRGYFSRPSRPSNVCSWGAQGDGAQPVVSIAPCAPPPPSSRRMLANRCMPASPLHRVPAGGPPCAAACACQWPTAPSGPRPRG